VHCIPERDDLGNALVPEREGSARREQARGEEEVDVAARDGERTDEGLEVPLELRLRHVAPFEGVRSGARELSHAHQISSATAPSQTIFRYARWRPVQPLPSRRARRPASRGAPRSAGPPGLRAGRRDGTSLPTGPARGTGRKGGQPPGVARTGTRSTARRRGPTPPR